MAKIKSLLDIYRFPGFVPFSSLRGVFGDHRAVVARPRPGEPGFDILHFFLRDPQFAELLSHYKVRSRTSFETFELVSPWPRVARSQCTVGA